MNDEWWKWKCERESHTSPVTHTHHIDVMYSIFYHVVYIHTFIHFSSSVVTFFDHHHESINNPMLSSKMYKNTIELIKGIKKIYFYRTKTYFQYFFFVFSIFCQRTIKGSLVFSFLLLLIVWIVSTTIHVQQIIDNSLSFLRLKHIKFMRQEQIVLGRQLGCIHGSIGIHQRHRHKDHGQHIPCGIWTLYQQCTFCRQWW